ncbi:MAG: LL-diaminopimelate aminotransferase [Actinomycetota bacterium]
MRLARRLDTIPPYLFAELDRKIEERRAAGVDVISLAVGDPDLPTPPHVVEALQESASDPSTHRYPSYYGMPELRRAIAGWYERRFGVDLDPETEVQPLIGSKEGIAHLPLAVLDSGDEALVADPGYPVYEVATRLAGGKPIPLPLSSDREWLADLGSAKVSQATKMLWLNYPNNPTAAVAEPAFFDEAVAFAKAHELLLAHDAAYTELTYEGFVAPSALQSAGAKDVVIEFGSASKTYNMTGWRIGWAVGNAGAIRALATIKTNIDSGIFGAVQRATIAALEGPQDHLEEMRAVYQKRRDVVVGALHALGWDLEAPRGSIYVWFPTRDGAGSTEFAALLLDRAGVVVSPGNGYGPGGEGYCRISLTIADDRLGLAMERIREALE